MIAFIKEHREDLGVEPVCKVLPIAQSTFYAHVAIARNPDLASDRAKRDVDLSLEIKRVWDENNQVYGIRKVWHQLQREKFTIARCTVARLMKHLAIQGVIRGKVKKTTVPDKVQPRPKDQGNREVRAPAPNMLWVSDFTRVSIWQGVVYVAFIIDTFADKIVGWRVSNSPKTDFVLDTVEQALHDRRPVHKIGLSNHSDRGGQYLSIRYTERLADAGIDPSVGSVGNSYDTALAETHQRSVQGRSHSPARTLGKPWPLSHGKPSNGSIGSTTVACLHPSDTSRHPRLKRGTMHSSTH